MTTDQLAGGSVSMGPSQTGQGRMVPEKTTEGVTSASRKVNCKEKDKQPNDTSAKKERGRDQTERRCYNCHQ